MSDEIRRLRRVLAEMTRGRGRRYPPEIRQRVGAAAVARRRDGVSWQRIGGEFGIPHETVRRLAAVVGGDEVGDFKRVEISAGLSASSGLSLTTPAGHRVDGLDVESAAELLRRLT
jgi:hypothetical protein